MGLLSQFDKGADRWGMGPLTSDNYYSLPSYNEKKFLTLIQFQLRLLKPPSGEGPRTPKGRGDGAGE